MVAQEPLAKAQVSTPKDAMAKVGPDAIDGGVGPVGLVGSWRRGVGSMSTCNLLFKTNSSQCLGQVGGPNIAAGIHAKDYHFS